MSAVAPPRPLERSLLEVPVRGRRLRGATLGACLSPSRTLLVFLRHLG